MIIRGHRVLMTAQRILDAVIQHVNENVQIGSADRFTDDPFCFSGPEAGTAGIQQIACLVLLIISGHILIAGGFISAPACNILINQIAKAFAALHSDDAKIAVGKGFKVSVRSSHYKSPL